MAEAQQVRHRRAESPKPPTSNVQNAGTETVKKNDVKPLRLVFDQIPVQCNGFALGLCGLAGAVLNFQALIFGPSAPFTATSASLAWLVACSALLLAFFNQVLYLMKLAAAPRKTWQADFCSVATCAGQVSHLTVANGSVALARVLSSWPDLKVAIAPIARAGVAYGVVMQLMCMARFYQLVRRESHPRSVLYFAPSVSLATLAVTGGAVGMPGQLMALSFWMGIGLVVWLLPVILWRVLQNRSQNANPSIGFLAAPGAYMTIAWHAAKKTSPVAAAWLGPYAVGDLIFTVSVIGVCATIYCSWARAKELRSTWFSSPWAAFTFPTVSCANAALLQAAARPHPLVVAYAICLSAFVIALVSTINVAHIMHMAKLFGLRSNAQIENPDSAPKKKS